MISLTVSIVLLAIIFFTEYLMSNARKELNLVEKGLTELLKEIEDVAKNLKEEEIDFKKNKNENDKYTFNKSEIRSIYEMSIVYDYIKNTDSKNIRKKLEKNE
jgi:hypothetical protein